MHLEPTLKDPTVVVNGLLSCITIFSLPEAEATEARRRHSLVCLPLPLPQLLAFSHTRFVASPLVCVPGQVHEFVKLGQDHLVPYYADILGALLPCIADKEEKIRAVSGALPLG